MIINADFLLPHLKEKLRLATRDASRHLLCPHCRRRTRLYRLRDDRRKCSSCGRKFFPHPRHDMQSLREYAAVVLCFCLDFPAKKTASLLTCRYPLVAEIYMQCRRILARHHGVATPERRPRLLLPRHEIRRCAGCRRALQSGKVVPIFGVRKGRRSVQLEPLLPERSERHDRATNFSPSSQYQAFIAHGALHRFADHRPGKEQDQLELFWSWAEERIRAYRGTFSRHTVFYLREFEWKYNHRHLTPQMLAMRLVLMLPTEVLAGRTGRSRSGPVPR